MIITQITLFPIRIRLKQPFIISLGPLEYAENVIVKIETNEGLTGYGECSPFRTIHGESLESGITVAEHHLAPLLIGEDPLELNRCIEKLDKGIYGNTSIKSAINIALYDIASRAAHLPLYKFIGGKINRTLYTDYTVSLNEVEKMVADAIKIKSEGYIAIKIKLGGSLNEDIQRIEMIRQAIGKDVELRLDANQGWNAATALEILQTLAPLNIEHCEEPIPRWRSHELPQLCASSPIPIMADESCFDHNDAQRLIETKSCHRINIKLGKSSGFTKALKIIQACEAASLPIQIGGFLESRLGFTASAHLAMVSDKARFIDFDTPLMFSEDPIQGGIRYGKRGTINLPDNPGLGAFPDPDYLKSLDSISIK